VSAATNDSLQSSAANPDVSSPVMERLPKKSKLSRVRSLETHCAVCMEGYEGTDTLCELRCAHYFHDACVSQWLRVSWRWFSQVLLTTGLMWRYMSRITTAVLCAK
jgi:hypothetical protein